MSALEDPDHGPPPAYWRYQERHGRTRSQPGYTDLTYKTAFKDWLRRSGAIVPERPLALPGSWRDVDRDPLIATGRISIPDACAWLDGKFYLFELKTRREPDSLRKALRQGLHYSSFADYTVVVSEIFPSELQFARYRQSTLGLWLAYDDPLFVDVCRAPTAWQPSRREVLVEAFEEACRTGWIRDPGVPW